MTAYRYELGFDRHAAPLHHTKPSERLFPLQASLIDVTKGQVKPAWVTKLTPGDSVAFRLVDITDLVDGTGNDPGRFPVPDPQSFALHSTDPKDRSRAVQVLEPTVHEWAWTPFRGPSPVFGTASQAFVGLDLVTPEGLPLIVRSLADGPLMVVELSFRVVFWDGDVVRNFVHDPEMIVSGSGSIGSERKPTP